MEDHDSRRSHQENKHKQKRKHTSHDYEREGTQTKRHKHVTQEEQAQKHTTQDDEDRYQKHSGRNSELDQPNDNTIPVHDFNWEQHRYTLNQIFFTDDDYIKRYLLFVKHAPKFVKENQI